MIEKSVARTAMDYTPVGSFEVEEKCSICEEFIRIGEKILRDKKTKRPICKDCISEVKRVGRGISA